MAMWQIYGASHASVAIQTRYAKLRDALPNWVRFGVVNYIDEDQDSANATGIFQPLVSKRKAFEYEREVRGILWANSKWPGEAEFIKSVEQPTGLLVPVKNLQQVLEQIRIHPDAPLWLQQVIAAATEKYECATPTSPSPLGRGPIW
jgi:predicted component of viral defense system (DUF524 family)